MSEHQFLFARQPIFDTEKNIVAYELLYRAEQASEGPLEDGDQASSHVLVSAFTEMAIGDVVGQKLAFINFTPHLIVNPPPFDPATLVVEVLETVKITDEVRAGIVRLKNAGFKIALDDYHKDLDTVQLLEMADIVKLDVLALSNAELLAQLAHLKHFDVTLLAEKIETYEMYDHCVDLGFDMFQGYFLSHPQLVTGRRVAESQLVLTNLLRKICASNVDIDDLAQTVAADPVLSYKLLRLVNSAMYSPRSPIESLQHAISFLGIDQTRNWTILISLSNVGGKPPALALTTLVRARFSEQLATLTDSIDAKRSFTVGLLSTLDAFFDTPLADIVEVLKLRADLAGALLSRQGPTGLMLDTVILFERAEWDAVAWHALAELGINQVAAEEAYVASLKWADETFSSFSSAAS